MDHALLLGVDEGLQIGAAAGNEDGNAHLSHKITFTSDFTIEPIT
jgi:hypothetical protein